VSFLNLANILHIQIRNFKYEASALLYMIDYGKKILKYFSIFKTKKGQQAVEYVTIFGIVALIIATSLVVFTKYSSSTQDDIILETTEGTLNILVKEAERVYYIGKGSKNTLRVNIPGHIKEIKACDTSSECPKEITALIELSTGTTELSVGSEAPISVMISNVRGTKTLLIHYTDLTESGNFGVKIEEIQS